MSNKFILLSKVCLVYMLIVFCYLLMFYGLVEEGVFFERMLLVEEYDIIILRFVIIYIEYLMKSWIN